MASATSRYLLACCDTAVVCEGMSAAIARKRCLIALPIRDYKLMVSGLMLFPDRPDCVRCVLNALVESVATGVLRIFATIPKLRKHDCRYMIDDDRDAVVNTGVLPVLSAATSRFCMHRDIVNVTASFVWTLARSGAQFGGKPLRSQLVGIESASLAVGRSGFIAAFLGYVQAHIHDPDRDMSQARQFV